MMEVVGVVTEPPGPVQHIKLENDLYENTLTLGDGFAAAPHKGKQPKKSSAERAAELLKDPRLGAVERHQVLCRMCGNWIRLFKHSEYAPANWRAHAERCEARTNWHSRVKQEPSSTFELPANADPIPPFIPFQSFSGVPDLQQTHVAVKQEFPNKRRVVTKTTEARREMLVNDQRAEALDPHRVLCKFCHSWVKLHNTREYDLFNWGRHIDRCELRHTLAISKIIDVERIDTSLLQPPPTTTNNTLHQHFYPSMASAIPPYIPPPPAAPPPTFPSKKRKSRTVEERLQILLDDPRCDDVRPDMVHCVNCQRWVKLAKDIPYIDSNWQRHAARCNMRSQNSLAPLKLPKTEVQDPSIATGSVLMMPPPDVSESSHRGGKTAEQRAQELRDDPRTSIVYPDRVLCNICKSWVRLQIQRDYDSWNWRRHVEKCEARGQTAQSKNRKRGRPRKAPPNPELIHTIESDSESASVPTPPSAPLRTKEDRRQILINDSRCSDVSPSKVTCKICMRSIGLHSSKEYFVSNWFRHVESCEAKSRLSNGAVVLTNEPPVLELGEDGLVARLPKRPKIEEFDVLDLSSHAHHRAVDEMDVDVKPTISRQRSTEERKLQLESDVRAGPVEPNRIFCKLCDRWLKLSENIPYSTFNWFKHIGKCETRPKVDTTSAKRQGAESREQRLRADPRCEKAEPARALCKLCGNWVKLRMNVDYDIHNWNMHADRCEINTNGFKASSGPSASSLAPVAKQAAEERERILRSDPRCATVEPYRILCGVCHEWIRLRTNQQFGMYNWQRHIEKCERLKATSAIAINQPRTPAPIVIKDEPDSKEHLYGTDATGKVRDKRDIEREAQLRADIRLDAVELGRVHCRMCNSWIRLNMSYSFVPGNWLRHAERCQAKTGWRADGAAAPTSNAVSGQQPRPDEGAAPMDDIVDLNKAFGFIELGHLVDALEPVYSSTAIVVDTDEHIPIKQQCPEALSVIEDSAELSVVSSYQVAADASKRMHRTTEQRRRDLELDPRVGVVETDRVLCRYCQKWIQLRKDVSYSAQNWIKHASICEPRNRRGAKTFSISTSLSPVKLEQGIRKFGELDTSLSLDQQRELPYSAKIGSVRLGRSSVDKVPAFKPANWNGDSENDDDDEEETEDIDDLQAEIRNVQVKTEAFMKPMSIFEFEKGFMQQPIDYQQALNRPQGPMQVPAPSQRPVVIEIQ